MNTDENKDLHVLSDLEDDYTLIENGMYEFYPEYEDTNYSTVTDTRDIILSNDKVIIAQELNSQYIPFKIKRYWDGVDLTNMLIRINFLNSDFELGASKVINVRYNSEYITFGWLIERESTTLSGNVKFEILAIGNNSKGKHYLWRTKPNDEINVLEGLDYDGVIEPTAEWYTSFQETMVDIAMQAKEFSEHAQNLVDELNFDNIIANIKAYVDEKFNSVDSLKCINVEYDDTTGVMNVYDTKNGNELLDSITIDRIGRLKMNYSVQNGKGTISLLNDTEIITSVEVGEVDPSTEWSNSFRESIVSDVTEAYETADSEIKEQLKDLSDAFDEKLKNIDLSEIESDIESVKSDLETTNASITEVKESIEDINGSLEEIIDTKLVEVNDAITEVTNSSAETKNKVDVLGVTVEEVSQNFDSVSVGLGTLENKISELEKRPSNTYDIDYTEDYKLKWYENGEVIKEWTIQGGGGGSTQSSTITINRITPDGLIKLIGDSTVIKYEFSSVDATGDSTGAATAIWRVGSTNVKTETITQGLNSFDITPYLKSGSNNVRISITDSFGNMMSKTWGINVLDFKIESSFDDSLFYSGDVVFRYTPYGDVEKNIVFVLDGEEIGGFTTSITARQLTYTIPSQEHGSHDLEVYMTAMVNGNQIRSNSLHKSIIWVDVEKTEPIIGCSIDSLNIKQYESVNIPYVVYDPSNTVAEVSFYLNEVLYSVAKVDRRQQKYNFKSSEIGECTLTILCGNARKEIVINVNKLDIDVEPVMTNLGIDFNPAGRSNNDVDKLWSDGTYHMSVSDNFDWVNGGFQTDSDGDTYFCVKAGTKATLDYQLFGQIGNDKDTLVSGKEFKFIYRCTNVKNYDANVLNCYNNGIGLKMNAQNATLYSSLKTMTALYRENDLMEIEFNILPLTPNPEMVCWIDGVPEKFDIYDSADSFTQVNPVPITIGSDDCDVHLYRFKAYKMNLTDDEIMDNFIADAKNPDEMVQRYNRNNIFDENGQLDPDLLAEKCPDLRIIKIECPKFTTGKKDKVAANSFQQIYKNGREIEDNWFSYNGQLSGQGTSSDNYGDSGRNLDINCKNGFTFGNGTTGDNYALTENSVPVNYFNIKVNVASSEGENNKILADEFNNFNPYRRQARKDNVKVRDTMEFHECVIFIKETNLESAVEFDDGQWHFYGCGCIGNSKKNSEALGMNPDNHKEFIVEIANNTCEVGRFLKEVEDSDWVAASEKDDPNLEFRYNNPDCTDEEKEAGRQAFKTFVDWVVNATPQTFVSELEDHVIKDTLLFHYLFTDNYTMIDNRAKNTFWHTEDLIHWDLCFDYDNDTAMGNDNEGGLTLTYGYEDTDVIGTKSVYNAADSKLYCYTRDYLFNELASMYTSLESQLCWDVNRIINRFDTEQSKKPERLWAIDMRRKYFRPYESEAKTTSYIDMMNGKKKYQRRQFLTYQNKYIASKYVGNACLSDVLTIRGYTPTVWEGVRPDGTFHIMPYADTYVVCRFGSALYKQRAKRGQVYTVTHNGQMNDTEVYVYNASVIQSIGDISAFYPGYTNFTYGSKLTDLLIGSNVSGYSNTNMINFTVGNNVLIEEINLQNTPNLKISVDLSNCKNLETFLADGSGITGVSFADGGKLKTASLPSVTAFTAKHLDNVETLDFESMENLTTLVIESCSSIDELELVNNSPNLNRIRLTGIDWTLTDLSLLDRLAELTGKDENNYDISTSVLSGKVFAPVMKEQSLNRYKALWSDLEITYNTLVETFKVTFVNDDENETVLDVQYVDKGGSAVDPITREINPIAIPAKENSISSKFTFSKWDTNFNNVFADRIIKAVYTESPRTYTVRYYSKGTLLQESQALYGETVEYEGGIPTYTAEEAAFRYYLFKGWDKSGFVNGDKNINAVYDSCEYRNGYFNGKELANLSQVEIYTMMKVGLEQSVLDYKDSLNFEFGTDYNFDDVESNLLISSPVEFKGDNYIDTEVNIFDIDRSFTFAIDFEFAPENKNGATLMQCYQYDGSNGFRLWYSSDCRFNWGTATMNPSYGTDREMLVFRHIKGSPLLYVYASNHYGNDIITKELEAIRIPILSNNATLIFGAAKADDGAYENYAKGTVHWSKIWYDDLGDSKCKELAQWTHESIKMELAKFKSYYRSDVESSRANITFFAADLLSVDKPISTVQNNNGGWANTNLNTWMNNRLLKAINPLWKALIKPVKVQSSAGNKTSTITTSNCYFYIPSIYEVDNSVGINPYINETDGTIPYITSNELRQRKKPNAEETVDYWTRSPNINYNNYYYGVSAEGYNYGYEYPTYDRAIAIMFSIGV